MSEKITYKFRTVGSAGNVEISDNTVRYDLHWRYTHCSFCVPLCCISTNPVHMRRVSAVFHVFIILAMVIGLIGLCALIDRNAFWFNTYGAMIFFAASALLITMAFYYRMEEWMIFPTDSPARTLAIARNGPDADRFESFMEVLSNLVETSQAA